MKLSPIRFAPLALFVAACGGSPGGAGEGTENTGQTSLAIATVPATVQCIQITVSGSSTVTSKFDVTPGASSVGLSLGQLPLGSDTITGQAYDATCDSIAGTSATYVADSQTVTLEAGIVTKLTMTFRPENSVSGTANFVGNVVGIAPVDEATYLVMSDGTVEVAGYGYTATPASNTPIPYPNVTTATQIAGGALFNCAILTSGAVECWGGDSFGELGNGTVSNVFTPGVFAVTGLTSPAVQLSLGDAHACVVNSSGFAECWGYNGFGQLGNGTTTNAATPVTVSVPYQFETVVAGAYSTCGSTSTGAVVCWGYNSYGQLGNNSTTSSSTYVIASGLTATVSVVAGFWHFCALRADGTVRCWGANYDGQLGNGTTTQSLVPVQVPISGVTQIAASENATCARNASGLYCWGDNTYGEVGDGTGTNRTSPVLVSSLSSPVTSIQSSSTSNSFCAQLANGTIDCWGANGNGELGNGSTDNAFVPTPLSLQ